MRSGYDPRMWVIVVILAIMGLAALAAWLLPSRSSLFAP
jgi:hypothetical protein